jgi:hypothetical protein
LYKGATVAWGLPAMYVLGTYFNPVVPGGGATRKCRGKVGESVKAVGSSRDGGREGQVGYKW